MQLEGDLTPHHVPYKDCKTIEDRIRECNITIYQSMTVWCIADENKVSVKANISIEISTWI